MIKSNTNPNEYGALMIDSTDNILSAEITNAIAVLKKVAFERPNMAKEIQAYRKFVPVLIDYVLQQQKVVSGFEKMFARMETDSEDKKGQRWCEAEDNLLVELVCQGMSMLELSTTLGRTPSSIKTRLSRLVGTKRVSQDVVGRFIGYIDGNYTEGSVQGTVYKE